MTPSLADYARGTHPPSLSTPPRSPGHIHPSPPHRPPPSPPPPRSRLHALGANRTVTLAGTAPAALAFAIPFFILAASPSGSAAGSNARNTARLPAS